MKKPKFDFTTIGLGLMAGVESAHGFSSTMPSHFTIKSFAVSGQWGDVDEAIGNLRSGYAPALGFAGLIGGAASLLSKSWLPLAFSALTSVFMIWTYELALPSEKRLGICKAFSLPAGSAGLEMAPEILEVL